MGEHKHKNGNPAALRPVPQPEARPLPSADCAPVQGPPQQVTGLDLLDGAKAFGLWILLERVMDDEKSPGGIILPEAVREKPAWVVRSVGEKVTIPIKEGDHVAFDGTRIMVGTDQTGKVRAVCWAMEGQIQGKLNPAALRGVIITQRYAP